MSVKNEPALAVALLQALIAVGISFGLKLTPEQVGAIVTLATAVGALLVRQRVTPASSDPGPTTDPAPAPAQA